MLRITFSSVFLLLLFYNMFYTERRDVITADQCIVDKSFEWTSNINSWLVHHIDVKNRYIVYASLLMDLMVVSYITIFIFCFKSFRVILSYVIFFGIRCFI